MIQYPCIGCGRRADGYIFDNESIGICRQCRDVWLTWFEVNGFAMTDSNWIIADLCIGSHAVTTAWWQYHRVGTTEPYGTVTQTKHLHRKENHAMLNKHEWS